MCGTSVLCVHICVQAGIRFAYVIYNAYLCVMKDFLINVLFTLVIIGLGVLGIGAIATLIFILRPLIVVMLIGLVIFVLYLLVRDLFN
jgi:hypothetical protein